MKYRFRLAAALAAPWLPAQGYAQDTSPPPPITVSGSASVVSDYRFRGVSQSDKDIAVQGGITATHDSGAYAGVWASTVGGWGSRGGADVELDLIGGYKFPVGRGGALDLGVTGYFYPAGRDATDFVEPYARLSGTIGPLELLAGAAYAPKQRALANVSATPQSHGQSQDNLYLWGDATAGIPTTPVTLKAHIGRSDGNPGLAASGTSLAPTGHYWDWSLGARYVLGPVTLGASYVDTDIGRARSAYLRPNFASTQDGGTIAGPRVVFSVSTGF